jgi:hypothetical protein
MTGLDTLQLLLQLIIAVFVAVWSIYQAKFTKNIEQEVHRLNIGLDQSIQLLHRAREAVIQIHKAHVFLLEFNLMEQKPSEIYLTKHAELSAHKAELRGLAFAIGDKELLKLVNEGYSFSTQPQEERNITRDEMEIRLKSQKLHTRISQLLETTAKTDAKNA